MKKRCLRGFSLALALLLSVCTLQFQPELAAAEEAGSLRISELMVKNKASLRDEDGDFSDWIELENASGAVLDLTGWRLSDRGGKKGWELPARTLESGEFLLVYADGKDRAEGELHSDFSLSEGETLFLRRPDGEIAERVLCSSDADRSLLRGDDGSFTESDWPTPGLPNTAAAFELWQESLALPAGPLVISEVASFETAARFDGYYGNCDWVEIRNTSGQAVDLSGWHLSDKGSERERWAFPAQKLGAGQSLLLRCSETPAYHGDHGDLCTGFSLDSRSEQLYLSDPNGVLVDYAALRGIPYDRSYGRIDGRPGWFYFNKRTPGGTNAEGCRRISSAPMNSAPDGVFEGVEGVTVELLAAGEIYYTTDGSLPTAKSQRYEGPLLLTKTTVLRAIAVEDGALRSPALNLSYFINEGHSLPVISLVTDDPYSFRKMYDNAMKGVKELGALALYEKDGSFHIPCEVKLNGETSLVLPKKNLSVRFRDAYGEGTLEYDCFDGGVSSFTNLLLRSGQDYAGSLIRNELVCSMAAKATDNVLVQRFKYGVLYINGGYRGIYALEEKANEQMFADHLGVSRDSVTVHEASVRDYTDMYRDVIGPILKLDMRREENYRAVCEHLDIDSLIDWIIIEGWCGNKDLQSGNLRYGRSTENDGRWRFILYDLDAVFSSSTVCFDVLADYSLQGRQIGQMIASLLRNDSFRAQLLSRAAALLNGPLSDEATLEEIDRLCALLEPEVARNHSFVWLDPAKWTRNVGYLRSAIIDGHWHDSCIRLLCQRLRVGAEERALYFGG